jgi:hypothetical protein
MSFVYSTWLAATMAAATLLLAGCVGPRPVDHPQGWDESPAPLLANGCPDLSGTYDTRPSDSYPADVEIRPLLNEILGARGLREGELRDVPWPELPGTTTATFEPSGDWLYVRFGDGAGGETTLSFRRRHWWAGDLKGVQATYHCLMELELGPTLAFDGSFSLIFALPYIDFGHEKYWFLSKGRDGALIVNYRAGNGPWAWVASIWWRYLPVASNR